MKIESGLVFETEGEGCAVSAPSRRADFSRAEPGHASPPEIAALAAAGVSVGPLTAALAAAARTGAEPFDELVAAAGIPAEALVSALARAVRVDVARSGDAEGPAIDADAFSAAMKTGVLRLEQDGGAVRYVVAARGRGVRGLVLAQRGKPFDGSVALATPALFAEIATARAGAALADRAAEGPARLHPRLTVAGGLPSVRPALRAALVGLAAALAVCAVLHDGFGTIVMTLVGLVFALLNGFRLCLAGRSFRPVHAPLFRRDARDLPVYTVMVALYREAAVVPGLLAALERLDYPALGSKSTKIESA